MASLASQTLYLPKRREKGLVSVVHQSRFLSRIRRSVFSCILTEGVWFLTLYVGVLQLLHVNFEHYS